MDYILLHNRAKLVKKYRENPKIWPDGIDHAGNRWYGDGGEWPQDKVELWATERWLDDVLRGVTHVAPAVTLPVTQLTAEERKRQQTRERVRKLRERRLFEAANPEATD